MEILKWKGLDIDPMKISESIITKPQISQIDTAFNESTSESGITVLYPKIEAIHEGRTRNFNRYPLEKLKGDPDLRSGVYSWTNPYPKPVIYNHDVETACTGRVHSASFSEFTAAGRPGIIVTPKITDAQAIKDILEGRLLTVSIGATTNAAVCSICGTDIINEGWCGHWKGDQYDGQVCEWVAGDLFFDELSWVNVPADSNAMVTNTGTSYLSTTTGEGTKTTSSSDITTSPLTRESVQVKSVSESTEKEENIVPLEDQTTKTVPVEPTPVEPIKEEPAVQVPSVETPVEDKTQEPAVEEPVATEPVAQEPVAQEPVQEDNVQEQLDKATKDLKNAQDTIDELHEANQKLAKDLHEATMTFLVDLRCAIGKEGDREEAMGKYKERSLESLRDAIADLLVEKPSIQTTPAARTIEHVEKPTGEPITDSKVLATEAGKVISNEDALISLLTGRK